MNFPEAMTLLYSGTRVTRKEWSPGNFLLNRVSEQHGLLIELYVDNGKNRITWSPSGMDLRAEDWEVGPAATTITVSPPGMLVFDPMGGR